MAKPDYGVDAPSVVGTFGVLAFVLALAGALSRAVPALSILLWIASAVPLLLAASMLAYAKWGKLRIRDYMLRRLAGRNVRSILDVGCGRGLLSIGAALRFPQSQVVGIDVWSARDLSGNSQDNALSNIRRSNVSDRVEVKTADARSLPFDDASFDAVLSLLCIHNIEPKDGQAQACREIARVLKPGGVALLADYVPTHGYATVLREEGFTVTSSHSCFSTALGLMWLLEAEKPLTAGLRPPSR